MEIEGTENSIGIPVDSMEPCNGKESSFLFHF